MDYSKFSLTLLILAAVGGLWLHCDTTEPFSSQAEQESKIIRHDQNITTHEVWESNKTHVISREIFVDHAVLTIKAGTTLQFESEGAISVADSGGLIADGSKQPIVFSTMLAEKGAWKHIYFGPKALDDSCKLINCTIEYGGGNTERDAIIFCDNAAPTITGCTITNAPATGVTLVGDCRGITFQDNIIANCDFVPIQTAAINIPWLGKNIYQDNAVNQIRIIDGNIPKDAFWQNPGVPYRVGDGLKIKTARLSLEPGIAVLVEYDEGITISDGGSLRADASTGNRIVFTGSDVGRWNGIHFTATANDVDSRLVNCVVEFAGQAQQYPANIVLENSSPEISSCLIRQSIGYGVYITGQLKPGSLKDNTITNNALAPICIAASGVSGLAVGSYRGNGRDVIEVRGGPEQAAITVDSFWDKLEIPYQVRGIVQVQSANLILAPGVVIRMGEGSGFEILVQGGFIADGTSNMITIEALQPTPGFWKHIYFHQEANEKNCQLINCTIAYGGGDVNEPGMIFCDNVSPIVRNCRIEYSQSYGIYLKGSADVVDLQSNFFNGNGYGDYFKTP